jgi:heme-degrading monooxygenase HmoA
MLGPVIDHDLIVEKSSGTWARVTTLESDFGDRLEDVLRQIVDDVIPAERAMPGWMGAVALASENRQRGVVITFWDSVEHLVASGRDARTGAGGAGEGAGLDVVSGVQPLEVVLDERPE